MDRPWSRMSGTSAASDAVIDGAGQPLAQQTLDPVEDIARVPVFASLESRLSMAACPRSKGRLQSARLKPRRSRPLRAGNRVHRTVEANVRRRRAVGPADDPLRRRPPPLGAPLVGR